MSRTLLRAMTRSAALALLICGIVALPGCVVRGSSETRTTGQFIGDQTISRVEPGETSKDWVLAVFGEPTSRTPLGEGVEIWKWEYRRVQTSSGSVLFVFDSDNRSEQARNVYVEFEGDVVDAIWRD